MSRRKDNTNNQNEQAAHETPAAMAAQPQEIAEQYDINPDELSNEVVELIQQLQAERDEANEARMRALADFKNYQRRSAENENRAAVSGATRVMKSLLPVIDHFELALQQKHDQMTTEQLAAGMEMVRQELMKALQACGMQRLEPQPGDEFDPQRHEAVMHQQSDEHESGRVVSTLQAGYTLDEMVLRPAKVAIASGGK